MAQVTEVRLVDDLDGGEADKSVVFAIDNKQYEIDLSDQHAAQLRDVFAPFIAVARRAGGASVVRARRGGAVRRSAAQEQTAAIREWAAAHGFAVSARGRTRRGGRAITPPPPSRPCEPRLTGMSPTGM